MIGNIVAGAIAAEPALPSATSVDYLVIAGGGAGGGSVGGGGGAGGYRTSTSFAVVDQSL